MVFAEEYYYIPDYLLESAPLFCLMEFEDTQLPQAQVQLLEMANDAIEDWQTKLVQATNNPEGWEFHKVKFTVAEQQELFFDNDCSISIYFERQPPPEDVDFSGYAESYLTFSDIVIFYLEPQYRC